MLSTYALAAYHAHILTLPTEGSESRINALLAEAKPLRENMLGDAEALARRGLLDSETVAAIRAGRGNIDTANDLVALSALFGASWDTVKNKTATTPEEMKRAGDLGPELLTALGVREHAVTMAPDALEDQRRRAYTLLVRAYDETRRAMAYLRWHEGDADVIIPSLYKGRGGRPKAEAGEDEGEGGEAGGEENQGGEGVAKPVEAAGEPIEGKAGGAKAGGTEK